MTKREEFYKVCKIGDINFIVVKDENDVISEKMLNDEEIKESSMTFSEYEDCSIEIKKYLEGM